MKFLTANWKNLILMNFKVNKELLLPYVPFGTELDDYNGDYFVSIFGFRFENTKVLGIKFPYHVHFEEVNLRFYVKDKTGEKGVVFIQEIVPKTLIKTIANKLYKEHYVVSTMSSVITENQEGRKVKYTWEKEGKTSFIAVETESNELELTQGSKAEFIAEHYLGFTKIGEQKTSSYRVDHPKWKHLQVKNYELNLDFEANYGKEFSFLNQQKPDSVFLMMGSPISVFKNKLYKRV